MELAPLASQDFYLKHVIPGFNRYVYSVLKLPSIFITVPPHYGVSHVGLGNALITYDAIN